MSTASCEGITHDDGKGGCHSEGTSAGRRSQWELRRIRSGEKVDTTDFRPHPDSGDGTAVILKTRLINPECDTQPVLYDPLAFNQLSEGGAGLLRLLRAAPVDCRLHLVFCLSHPHSTAVTAQPPLE